MQTSISWFLFFLMASPGLSLEREGQQESLSIGYDGTMHGTSSNRSSLMRKANLAAGRNGKEQIQSGTEGKGCTKWEESGWTAGRYSKTFGPTDAPNGKEWTWEQCAARCGAMGLSVCEFWTLQRTGDKQCLLMKDKHCEGSGSNPHGHEQHGCYQGGSGHYEGDPCAPSTPENGECPPGKDYRLIITTGTGTDNGGTLNVKVDEGSGFLDKVWSTTNHRKGSEVLDACFSDIQNIAVANPTTDAWAGTIRITKLGLKVETHCDDCAGTYTTDSKVVIDGNGDGADQAPAQCLHDKDYNCHFTPKEEPVMEVSGKPVIAIG